MNKKVLFVDDEENVLASYKRNFHKQFEIYTALSGLQGIEILKTKGPFAVIISDMQMPGMKGDVFLTNARTIFPNSSRIMLTGYAKIENAIAAVNNGHIFRFLTKPCPKDTLNIAINDGIRQYQLLNSEKDLLEKTLRNSIEVMTAILGMVNSQAFGRATRIQGYVAQIARKLNIKNIWQLEMAAMLSQIGFVTLPSQLLDKVYNREVLNEKEQQMLEEHPAIGAGLIERIPRMKVVSEIIAQQNNKFSSFPSLDEKSPRDKFVALGAQILKTVLGFDDLIFKGASKSAALAALKRDPITYNPNLVNMLENIQTQEKGRKEKVLSLYNIKPGMITNQNIISTKGKKLLAQDILINEPLIERLKAYDQVIGVSQPIKILV